jgi:hypothetical protein
MLLSLPESNGHMCYYGFDVDFKWLINYSKTHRKDWEDHDNSRLLGAAFYLPIEHSGIRTLKYQSANINHATSYDRSTEAISAKNANRAHLI